MNKLNPIKYIENMLGHHPKSISLWITEGIVINGERYIIKEFRLRDGSLYAVIAENKYTPKYFEVKLAPDEETLKDIYKAIEENKIAIEQEITDRKNEIARVDNAIKANTTKIDKEITDRKSEIARVDKAIEANTVKINKEIADRTSEIARVDKAINDNKTSTDQEISRVDKATKDNKALINKEIADRTNEITRVDKAINANTTKINQEIADRTSEITRVDSVIKTNTAKIDKEISDRKSEITRLDEAIKDNKTSTDQEITRVDNAIKANTTKINQEITNRQNEINRVDEAINTNTTKINQEISDRKSEITRVNTAIDSNTTKINKEITDRTSEIARVDTAINKEITDRTNEITRVDNAIKANTAKINKEINDRTSEVTRLDTSIGANTAKINKEITDRTNEIARVDSAINTNTTKINKEITDRKSEITRVEGKIPKSAGGRNLALGTSSEWSNPYTSFNGGINTIINIAKVLTSGLKVGDTLKAHVEVKYENIVPTEGKTATIRSQDSGNVTEWNNGGFSFSELKTLSDSGKIVFEITDTINSDHLKNAYWDWTFRLDYVKSGSVQLRLAKVEAGDLPTPWEPAPEDYDSKLDSVKSEIKQTISTLNSSLAQKQDKLTVGDGLSLDGNQINIKPKSLTDLPAKDGFYNGNVTKDGAPYATISLSSDNNNKYVQLAFRESVNTSGKIIGKYRFINNNVPTNWHEMLIDDTTIKGLIAQKQDKLTAGKGIAIQGNVISATGDSAPQHDTQKEQVLASTRNTITITHGTNGTSETTKVDTNPEKVLEHSNLLADYGVSKTTTGNTTKLGLEYKRVDGARFDLNNLINGKVRASDFVNAPKAGTWYFVSAYTEGSYAIQEAITLVDNKNTTYRRTKQEGTWGAWREQVGDKSTIGTVNLFKGSRDFSGTDWIGGAGVYVEDYKGVKIFKKQDIWDGRSQYFEVKTGEEYVFSAYVKSSAKTDGINFYLPHDSKQPKASGLVSFVSDNGQDSVNIDLTDKYKHIVVKIKITKDGWMAPRIERYNSDAYLFFGGYKLERGNIATDWSPAPEDIQEKITSVENRLITNLDSLNSMPGTLNATKLTPGSITGDMITGGRLRSTNGSTVIDLTSGIIFFNGSSSYIQHADKDKIFEIQTLSINGSTGVRESMTSSFNLRKSSSTIRSGVKFSLYTPVVNKPTAQVDITSDSLNLSDSRNTLLLSVNGRNTYTGNLDIYNWGDIPVANLYGGLIAKDVGISGHTESLKKIIEKLCAKTGITWL